jgi:hypothetical protein
MIDEMRCLGPSLDMIFCITAWEWRCEWIRGRMGGIRGNSVCSTYSSIQEGGPISEEVDVSRNIMMNQTLHSRSRLDLVFAFW